MKKLRLWVISYLAFFLVACAGRPSRLEPESYYWNLPIENITQKAQEGNPFAQHILSLWYLWKGDNDTSQLDTQKLSQYWSQEARKGLETLAQQGDAEAARIFGGFYLLNNESPVEDISQGLAYLEQAAVQGNLTAQVLLSRIYITNRHGIEPDVKRAQYWEEQAMPALIEAAKQNNPYWQTVLAQIYEKNSGSTAVYEQQAQYWYAKAVQGYRQEFATLHDHPLRMSTAFRLPVLYMQGQGVAQNYQKAYVVTTLVDAYYPGLAALTEGLQKECEVALSSDEFKQAQELAQQCRNKLSEACY